MMAAPVALSRSPSVTLKLRSPGTVKAEVAEKAVGRINRRLPLVSRSDALLLAAASFRARPLVALRPLIPVLSRRGLAALPIFPVPT